MATGRREGADQVVSICGLSCVGKGSLIDKLHLDLDGARERFGIAGRPEIFASRQQTRSRKTRCRPTKEMFRLPRPSTIVFRWQLKEDGLIDDLITCYPDAGHLAIVLWRPWDDQARDATRVHERAISRASQSQLWFKKIHARFGPASGLRSRGVEIMLVDASRPEYPEIAWPARH